MAKLAYGLNMSLDGFVDHDRFAPDAVLFRHFIEQVRHETASIYGRRMYEIMAYWDEDQPGWDEAEREYAEVWRAQPKYVVSRTLIASFACERERSVPLHEMLGSLLEIGRLIS